MMRIFRWLRNLILFFIVSSVFMVVLYRFIPVYITPLMVIRVVQQAMAKKTGCFTSYLDSFG